MIRRLKLLKNLSKRFTLQKNPKKIDFQFFDYYGSKFTREREKYMGDMTREEVYGSENIGFDSNRHLSETRKLWFEIFTILSLFIVGIVSVSKSRETMENAYEVFLRREYNLNKSLSNKKYSLD